MTIYLQFYFSSSSSVYLHDSKHVSKLMTTIAGPHIHTYIQVIYNAHNVKQNGFKFTGVTIDAVDILCAQQTRDVCDS